MFDRVTEAIAYFIGSFNVHIEDMRDRLTYDEIIRSQDEEDEDHDLENGEVNTKAHYLLRDFEPQVEWQGEAPEIVKQEVLTQVLYRPLPPANLPIELADQRFSLEGSSLPEVFGYRSVFESDFFVAPYVPGSFAVVGLQTTRLSDRDLVLDADGAFGFSSLVSPEAGFDALEPLAEPFDFHSDLAPPANEDEITDLALGFVDTAETLAAPEQASGALPEGTFIVHGTTALSGVFVNGQLQSDDAGDVIDDSAGDAEQDDAEEPSFSVSTGENDLLNGVRIFEAGTTAPVKMVAGDYVVLDMIIQYNIASGADKGLPGDGVDGVPQGAIEAVNSALIAIEDNADPSSAGVVEPAMPQTWTVSRIDGNLVQFNWAHQHNYVLDDDTVSMMTFGSELFLQTGSNTSYNSMSLVELGFRYDLIIVGGDVYDVNVVEQYNMLNDNDALWLTGLSLGDGVNGPTNTLTNDALIARFGETQFNALTPGQSASIDLLASGSDALGPDVLGAAANGFSHLNVLYIDGSILNLNYVLQSNQLSDADQIELLISGAADDWLIESGGNVMTNAATIIDSNLDAAAYVGGAVYSDALILQANLIDEPSAPGGDLANEAVVFLVDDMLAAPSEAETGLQPGAYADNGSIAIDPMQSIVA